MKENITNRESEVRSYCRKYPTTFVKAKGCYLYDENGNKYLDFLAGAGALNYGHNNDEIKEEIIKYMMRDGVTHSLDMYTDAKEEFIETFTKKILEPRSLDYKIQFCGPTGTNAIEAAFKLARKNKQRNNIIAFSGAFHGMTLGSVAATSDAFSRNGAYVPLTNVTHMPYPVGCNADFDTLKYLENVLNDDHSGIDKPAAIVLETVQAEGGINVAPIEWLQGLEQLCEKYDILLIVDEVQVGNSRTGNFFSFERAGINPDMVVLSKSIGGFGLPMAILLMKPELDLWKPAEHNGTFRGCNLSFVGATAGINYNIEHNINQNVLENAKYIENYINEKIISKIPEIELRGIGLIWGIDFSKVGNDNIVKYIIKECFDNGLIIEAAGRKDLVLKILPPLIINKDELKEGLDIINEASQKVYKKVK